MKWKKLNSTTLHSYKIKRIMNSEKGFSEELQWSRTQQRNKSPWLRVTRNNRLYHQGLQLKLLGTEKNNYVLYIF